MLAESGIMEEGTPPCRSVSESTLDSPGRLKYPPSPNPQNPSPSALNQSSTVNNFVPDDPGRKDSDASSSKGNSGDGSLLNCFAGVLSVFSRGTLKVKSLRTPEAG